jgi:uncharacterized YigZ family protein
MLFEDTYYSIVQSEEILYKSKGSKFHTYAFLVKNETEVKEHLNSLKSKYPDASHHCYSYVLNYDKSLYRINDDGEPSGTAGKPIYRQIQKFELTNILVVVVRYFGGTLLGVPGLIEAYGNSALEVLNKCRIEQYRIKERYKISCPFGEEKDIYRICKQFDISPLLSDEQTCFSAEIEIPLQRVSLFKASIKDFYKIELKYLGIE